MPLIEGVPGELEAASADLAVPAGETQLNIVTDAAGWSDDVVLRKEQDGHFYAEVLVDGRPYRMLVDTGASVVALTGADAAAIGLDWDDADVKPVAQGAGGAVNGVNVTIDRLSVGGNEAFDVHGVIIPDGLGVSLLGQSYLSTLSKVEITGDRMILGN